MSKRDRCSNSAHLITPADIDEDLLVFVSLRLQAEPCRKRCMTSSSVLGASVSVSFLSPLLQAWERGYFSRYFELQNIACVTWLGEH